MLSTSGYVFGSHMIDIGDWSFSANTAVVGSLPENCTCSSVDMYPRVMSLSWYICDATFVYPIAGPPARISSLTPVLLPLA